MASSIVSFSSSNSSSFGHVLRHQSDSDNILKLKLKKPKSWNWELSTSKSSAHIDFPRVLLYDTNNRLLADIEEANFIVNGKENESLPMHLSHSTVSNDRNRTTRKSNSFCVSSSSTKSSLKSPIIKIESDSHSCDNDLSRGRTSSRTESFKSHPNASAKNVIDSQNIPNDSESEKLDSKLPAIPILIYSAKGLIQRDFNAKEFDGIRKRSNSQANIQFEPSQSFVKETVNRTENDNVSHTTKPRNKQHFNDDRMKPATENQFQLDKNPLMKCNSMAEILANALIRSNSRRKIRRSKSSASTKYPFRCAARKSTEFSLPLSSSSSTSSLHRAIDFKSTNSKKPAYRIQKSAAGALIVPEIANTNGREHRRRRRHRSNSLDKMERTYFENNKNQSESNHVLKQKSTTSSNNDAILTNQRFIYPMDMSPVDDTSNNNQPNGIVSFAHIACDKHHNNKNRHKHSISIKNENSRLSAQSGTVSSSSLNNDANRSNGNVNANTKQKKIQQQQLNRKVSFVQVNDEMANKSGNDTIHNCIQETNEFNQNGKCISTIKSATGRRKKVYGKIKKSASVAGYYCNNHLTSTMTTTTTATTVTSASLFGESARKSTSDTDDYDFYIKPPMRHKKRRVSQRPRLSTNIITTTTATTTNATPYQGKLSIAILIVFNLDMEIVI